MIHNDSLRIRLCNDEAVILVCAKAMAASSPWKILEMTEAQCRMAFEGPCKEIWVAYEQETIKGFVILQTAGSFKGYIQTLFVFEEARRQGLGKKMLAFCEKRILLFSPNIFICVSSFNDQAAKLYEEAGFKLIGKLDNFLREGITELLLRKSAGPILGFQMGNNSNLKESLL